MSYYVDASGTAGYSIDRDNFNNLYVADFNASNIVKVTPAGVVSTFSTSTIPSISTAAFDSSRNNIYAITTVNNNLYKINSSGTVTIPISGGLHNDITGSGIIPSWCVDSGSNFYYTDNSGVKQVWQINTNTLTQSMYVDLSGYNVGQIGGLVFDNTNNLFAGALTIHFVASIITTFSLATALPNESFSRLS